MRIGVGVSDDGKLKGIRVGDGWQLFEKPESLPLTLRLEKQGNEYTFKLRHDANEAWTVLAPQTYSDTPQYVGLLGRGFSTGSDVMNLDWSYFQLDRWTAQEQINSSQSQTKPQGNSGLEGATSEPTRTPSESSTPTRIPTSTPTVTPSRTPISTPVWTPTSIETPISGLVPDELNQVPNFVLARYDQPNIPHKAMSILNQQMMSQTIDYTYDPLGRLTAADYSTGDYYHYSYDAVGNRLSQDSLVNNQQTITNYTYDNANRMTQVGNTAYTWDNNGNLLNDGFNTYTYNPANRLSSVTQGGNSYTYSYNGLGNRLQQTVNSQTTNYTLDLNAGLTQVLDDGTNTYLYGVDRIAQVNGSNTDYFLGDALGSVRQLTDANGAVSLYQEYDPYGMTTQSVALEGVQTSYGYDGEAADNHINLINLRSRMYDPATGRFTTKDSWQGNDIMPLSLNQWNFVEGDPVNYADPSGYIKESESQDAWNLVDDLKRYRVNIAVDWGYSMLVPVLPELARRYGWNCVTWKDGRWSLPELQIVKYAVTALNSSMKGKYNSFLPETTISLVPMTKCGANGRGCTSGTNVEFRDLGAPPSSPYKISNQNIIDPSVNFDVWSVVHELGHVWDGSSFPRHSWELMIWTQGSYANPRVPRICDPLNALPGCNSAGYVYGGIPPKTSDGNFTPQEDFAESVAAYVFPDVASRAVMDKLEAIRTGVHPYEKAQKWYSTYVKLFSYSDYRETSRWQFIDNLISR